MYEDGKPLFCGKDVCKALGYVRPSDAISAHVKGAVKRRILTAGGEQTVTFIPESDLYRLITHSKLPAAERFERWVFEEVLPTIRQTGTYSTQPAPDQLVTLAQTIAATMAAELAKQLLPLLQITTPQPVPIQMPATAVPDLDDIEIADPPRPRRWRCAITMLEPTLQREVDAMLDDPRNTYRDIANFLLGYGIHVSQSSICRYARRSRALR